MNDTNKHYRLTNIPRCCATCDYLAQGFDTDHEALCRMLNIRISKRDICRELWEHICDLWTLSSERIESIIDIMVDNPE